MSISGPQESRTNHIRKELNIDIPPNLDDVMSIKMVEE
jgi:hypothetical protein